MFKVVNKDFFKGFDVNGLEKMLKDLQDGLEPSVVKGGSRFPFSDICVSPEGILHFELAVAGFDKEDIEISKEDDMLIVKGTISEETQKDDEGMKYFQREISKRSFVKKFKLAPEYAESEQIDASTTNGILLISIWPVESKKAKSLKISIS